jgi:hypothetical protein
MDYNAKDVGEFVAYGTAAGYAFWKIFQNIYKFLKGIFKGDTPKPDKSSVTVNVSNPFTTPTDFSHGKEYYRYFLYFLLEQGKILKAMNDMKSDILREQMDYYNRHMINLKMAITNVMIELLKEAGIAEDSYTTYFSNFENFIEVCEAKIQTMYRQMCKDNHFSDYSNIEFKELIDRNIVILVGTVAELMRKRYPQKEFIKGFERVYKLKHTLKSSLKDCFEHARETSIEKEKKVKEAKTRFEEQVSEIIGMKYSLEI